MSILRTRKGNKFRWHSVALTLILAVVYLYIATDLQAALPTPPKVGSINFSEDDPIGYIVGSIRYIIFLGLTIVVVFALIGFSSGLIAEVNEARKNGEWGRFAIYFGAGIFVVLVVIFGAWWGSERLSEIINI